MLENPARSKPYRLAGTKFVAIFLLAAFFNIVFGIMDNMLYNHF
jgi:hypothetical protein